MYKIRKSNPASFANDPLFSYLNRVLGDYAQNMPKGAGIDWHHPNFLRPLQEYLVKNFLYDDRVQEILVEGRRASILAGRIIHDADSIVDTLQQYNIALSTLLTELDTEAQFVEAVLATT